MTFIPLDQAARRAAASSLDQNVIVLAGAGTGKTRLLIDRLTLLILGKEIPIEKIVALTFTKKAGEEMRERLEERLRKILEGSEYPALLEELFPANRESWPRLARRALDDIPKAQMGTIHSFAAHLLRLYPLQAGVDPNFREDEGTQFENIFEREWLRWLKEELGEAAPRATFWHTLLKSVEISDLRSLAKTLASPMTNLDRLATPIDIRTIVSPIQNQLAAFLNNTELPSEKKAPRFHAGLQSMQAVLKLIVEGKTVGEDLKKELRSVTAFPKSLKEAASEIKQIHQRILALSSVDENLVQETIQAVSPFVRRFRMELKRKGAVSFEGLLVYARNLVKNNPSVRAALKEKFYAFLVDEFQDTDPVQGEILFYLSEEPASLAKDWTDVRLAPGRLFVVGDPKQSIYRFRGAEMAAFEEFHQCMIRNGAKQATLSNNFRSLEPILNFVNHVFPFVMKEEAYLQPAYVPLENSREIAPGPAVEMIVAGKEDGLINALDGREAEANEIAEWIGQQVNKPLAGTTQTEPLRYSDISVLLRSSNAFPPYLEALRRKNIPYLAEGEKSFYLTAEIVDFMNLISVVADPSDTLALVGVLRSPLGALTDLEIFKLKEKDGLDYRKPAKAHKTKVEPLYALLREYSEKAVLWPVSRVIYEILESSHIKELTLQSSYGEQAVSNLMKVGALAKKWQDEAPLTMKAFVRRLRAYRDEERKEGENPLADASFNAVKVMTVHKAKGLEYRVVFLPNISAGLPKGLTKPETLRDWKTGLLGLRLVSTKKINFAMFLLEEELGRREEAEEVRVFFVAATRAKDKLILLRSNAKEGGRFSSYLKSAGVRPELGKHDVTTDKINIPVKSVIHNKETLLKGKDNFIPLSEQWDPLTLAQMQRDRKIQYEKLHQTPFVTSPSRLVRESEKIRSVEEDRPAVSSDAILVGLVCHKILEEWSFSTPDTHTQKKLETSLNSALNLYELSVGSLLYDEVKAEALKILTSFFSSDLYQRLTSVKIIGREVPFCYAPELKAAEGVGLVRGVIDLLYEEKGFIVVADYKTNRLSKGGIENLIDIYRPQGEAYVEAVEKSIGKKVQFELLFLREGTSRRL